MYEEMCMPVLPPTPFLCPGTWNRHGAVNYHAPVACRRDDDRGSGSALEVGDTTRFCADRVVTGVQAAFVTSVRQRGHTRTQGQQRL